jgi:transposase
VNRAALANFSRDDLIALILAQHEQIAAQAQQISALTARVGELEAKLSAPSKTPDNSSLPPSKGQKPNLPDPAKKKPRPSRPGVARGVPERPDANHQTRTAAVPKGKAIHAIVDNYATHKHPKVKEWLARHPRWTFHFTPTSSSWLNAVEGFFAKLTKRRLQRGVFCSVVELQAAINRFLAETNSDPRPFRWKKDPHKIPAAVKRGTKC